MSLSKPLRVLLPLALLLAAVSSAQIVRLTLAQMVDRTDNAVLGTIVDREVQRIDHPVDGPELYYTTLWVKGESLVDGQPITVGVTFPGGFVSEDEGVFNSEAPSADDQEVGRRVVVFYKWTENMGGDLAGNALYASHGGLFRTFVDRKGRLIVQGRGEGYAIPSNVLATQLRQDVEHLAAAKAERLERERQERGERPPEPTPPAPSDR